MAELRVIDAEPTAADVIETLEEVLASAKAGELSSVAIAMVYRDGAPGGANSALPSIASMLGAISILHGRIMNRHLEANP